MQFTDPQELSVAYLILRHLYDGDVIEWPIDEAHPDRKVFEALEAQGYIARWDRTWPRHDRYRLTDRGIAQIESVYRPAGADRMWNDLRSKNLSPEDRRSYIQSQGYDPVWWGILYDPSTHWDTWRTDGGRYHRYLWEDRYGRRWRRDDYDDYDGPSYDSSEPDDPLTPVLAAEAERAAHQHTHTVDLDHEASADGALAEMSQHSDYDVS